MEALVHITKMQGQITSPVGLIHEAVANRYQQVSYRYVVEWAILRLSILVLIPSLT